MSYLSGPRLHFAGRFRADVSTVNNFVTHFKNPKTPPQQGWNSRGSGSWSISNCVVTSAVYADGSGAQTSAQDPVIGIALVDNPGRKASLVDLDPEQQLVSQIWGLHLHLARPDGSPALAGAFKVAAFSDLWVGRLPTTGNIFDRNMSAFYQSLLTNVQWHDLLGSRLLTELKGASAAGLLSVKFNVDGFDQTQRIGRIVGTIGPALADEPAHFVLGRQCMPVGATLWFFPAVVDAQKGKLIADFGNALQTTTFRGPFDSALNLQIGMLVGGDQFVSLGQLPIGPDGWYEKTAGICAFPAGRSLSPAELTQLGTTQIGVVQQTAAGASLVAAEGSDGLYVRAEEFVLRMSAGETARVVMRATRFGHPLMNSEIRLTLDLRQLQPRDPSHHMVGDPPGGISFPSAVTTDAKGLASFPVAANSIAAPREYIDGQVYGVRYSLSDAKAETGSYFNSSDFLSLLIWSDYLVPAEPTWLRDVAPILKEYEELYPVMKGIVDLSNYDSVVANVARMQAVFSVPIEDTRYMPVTRDLSPAKRQMLLKWLSTTGNAGKPNYDVPVPSPMTAAITLSVQADEVALFGGKAAALRVRGRGSS